MTRKQCPRCGQYLAKDQTIHWKCVGARSWQLFRVPVGGVFVAFVLGMCALNTLPTLSVNTPVLPTAMVLGGSTNPTEVGDAVVISTSTAEQADTSPSTAEQADTATAAPEATNTPRSSSAGGLNAVQLTRTLRPNSTSVPEATSARAGATAEFFTGAVNTSRLNARSGPGSEYDQIVTLSRGHEVSLIGRTSDSSWVQIETPAVAWVNVDYLDTTGDIASLPVTFVELGDWGEAGTPTGAEANITATLRIRTGPGVGYKQLSNPDTLRRGATVDIVGKSADGEWYKVNIDTRSAWINSEGVDVTGNAEIPVMDS